MRIVCCQPAIKYYTWHIEVLVHNLRKYFMCPIDVVCGASEITEDWNRLRRLPADFYFYPDFRKYKHYPPSIYFHLMAQHLENSHISGDTIFMIDCDIALTKDLDLSKFTDDNINYLSDTNSYINYDYVISKGEKQLIDMCNIVGIDRDLVKLNNNHSGGGQYLIKNATSDIFWKAEKDSVKIYDLLCYNEPKWRGEGYPIQKWTAGMWAILWGIWKDGRETIVHKDLDFIMGTNKYSDIHKASIYHNAGITASMSGYFYKGAFIDSLPYNLNLKLGDNASRWYYEQIQKVEKMSLLY